MLVLPLGAEAGAGGFVVGLGKRGNRGDVAGAFGVRSLKVNGALGAFAVAAAETTAAASAAITTAAAEAAGSSASVAAASATITAASTAGAGGTARLGVGRVKGLVQVRARSG